MKIRDREVGPDASVFVVAEGGSSHGGELEVALALTDAAAAAGADAMKWQLFRAERTWSQRSMQENMARFEVPFEWLPALRDRAHASGLEFGCSVFDLESVDLVDEFVDFHKIASLEAAWRPLVDAVLAKRKPTMISTGGFSRPELDDLVAKLAWPDIVWMQCTLAYPALPEDADTRALKVFPRLKGFSDHTIGPFVAYAAVALGACVIEKHLRASMPAEIDASGVGVVGPLDTPDTPHSVPAHLFELMVQGIREIELVLGSSEKRVRDVERPLLKLRRGPLGLRGA